MRKTEELIKELRSLDESVTRLGYIAALLEWDQETYLPPDGTEERALQIALLMGLRHEKIVNERWRNLFSDMGYTGENAPEHLNEIDSAFLRETYKRWKRKTRIPRELVEEIAKEASLSQNAWAKARKINDYNAFAPHLKTLIRLQQEYAKALAPNEDAYDVLLDEYEPGATGAAIAGVFDELADGLMPLMEKIQSSRAPDTSFLDQPYNIDKQNIFGKKVQTFIGYDYQRGRLDLSVHPFATTLGPSDVRITTRYDENQVLAGLLSNIHEAGHGLYEQGMAHTLRGTLLAEGASYGIHESQSRFWENIVGRSRAFWTMWFSTLQSLFPENLRAVTSKDFFRAVNRVKPSLIRVEADEVSYSLHIIIRFRLEKALISGALPVNELPDAWREAYQEDLGIEVPNDTLGCMQDVHWAEGLFGYFPTYALGNLYAAQFTRAMEAQLGSLSEQIEKGKINAVLQWLREHIHQHGKVYTPGELCQQISGESLNPQYFINYLNSKYAEVYGF